MSHSASTEVRGSITSCHMDLVVGLSRLSLAGLALGLLTRTVSFLPTMQRMSGVDATRDAGTARDPSRWVGARVSGEPRFRTLHTVPKH